MITKTNKTAFITKTANSKLCSCTREVFLVVVVPSPKSTDGFKKAFTHLYNDEHDDANFSVTFAKMSAALLGTQLLNINVPFFG